MSRKICKQARAMHHPKPVLYATLAGFIILFLPLFYLPKALDYVLMLRLFMLSLFLLIYLPFVFLKRNPSFDFSILRNKFFWILSGYFIITVFSLFCATN